VRVRTRGSLAVVDPDLTSAKAEREEAARPRRSYLFEQADALFGDMPDGVMIQLDGRIVYANPQLAKLLGLESPNALVGTVALELYPESAFESVIARIQSAYFGRPAPVRRHPIRVPGCSAAEVDVSCLLLRLAGSPMLIEILRPV